jgi:ParB/RepB/Spo0J family partition protein
MAKQKAEESKATGNANPNIASVAIPLKLIKMDDARNSRQTTGLDKDSMIEFAESIRVNGLLSPVTVRSTKDGFDLIAGYRRTKAAKMLGWDSIPAIVKPEETSDQEARILNYVENVHRGDLSTYEKAHSMVEMLATGIKQTDLIPRLQLTQAQSTVDNLIRIYKNLDPAIREDWANPRSKVRPYLSMANLLQIVNKPIRAEKPGEVSQEQELRRLMGETNPAAMEARAAAIASGKAGAAGGASAKGESPIARVKKADISAAMTALEEAEVPEAFVLGVTAAFDMVLGRHGGALRGPEGKNLWAPEKKKAGKKAKAKKAKKTAKKE